MFSGHLKKTVDAFDVVRPRCRFEVIPLVSVDEILASRPLRRIIFRLRGSELHRSACRPVIWHVFSTIGLFGALWVIVRLRRLSGRERDFVIAVVWRSRWWGRSHHEGGGSFGYDGSGVAVGV